MSSSGKVLGTFSKAVAGSVAVNFGLSGGVHCETACVHHPSSTANRPTFTCYADRCEKRPDRSQLLAKLQRHEGLPPALIIGEALVELQQRVERGKKPPWIRLATNGSLPQPRKATKLFLRQLRAFLAYAKAHSVPVHIPVETNRKALFYRRHVGDLVVVRESLQSASAIATEGPVSIVAGTDITKGRDICKRRLEAARQLAKLRTEMTGRKTVVRPAVAAKSAKCKCGNCRACGRADVDIVYPLH